jgi:hypothetical protein
LITFRTVALLHEIMHVTCDQKYMKPAWAAADLYGRNLHVQQKLTTDGQVGQSIVAQQNLIDANYGRAITTLSRCEPVRGLRGPARSVRRSIRCL